MGRPKGSRSPEYEERRIALAHRVFETIQEDSSLSLRAIADRTGVSRPTLRHYFGSREGAVQAALESAAQRGRPNHERLATLPLDDARTTLRSGLEVLVRGWRERGVGDIHAVGLKVGLDDARSAQTYVADILEPLLGAMEHLLERLVAVGALAPHDHRQGALALVSPVMMVLIHQDGLGGASVRPLAVNRVVQTVVEAWCSAHPPRPREVPSAQGSAAQAQ